jgi:hypothetical protein
MNLVMSAFDGFLGMIKEIYKKCRTGTRRNYCGRKTRPFGRLLIINRPRKTPGFNHGE